LVWKYTIWQPWPQTLLFKRHTLPCDFFAHIDQCDQWGQFLTSPLGRNLTPQGWSCPTWVKLAQGVKLSPRGSGPFFVPSFYVNIRERSPLRWMKGWTIPVGNKVHPWGAKFTPRGKLNTVGDKVHPWGPSLSLGET
jgi:hypothetical protein